MEGEEYTYAFDGGRSPAPSLPAQPHPATGGPSVHDGNGLPRLAGEYLAPVQEPANRGYRGHRKARLRPAGLAGVPGAPLISRRTVQGAYGGPRPQQQALSSATAASVRPTCFQPSPKGSTSRPPNRTSGVVSCDRAAHPASRHPAPGSLLRRGAATARRDLHPAGPGVCSQNGGSCPRISGTRFPETAFSYCPMSPPWCMQGRCTTPSWSQRWAPWATVPASVIDYQLFERAFRLGPLAQAKQSRISRFAQRAFNWQPWWTIVMFAFTPIPFYPVRIAAPLASYPAERYVMAVFVGRLPRYYILAWGGEWAAGPAGLESRQLTVRTAGATWSPIPTAGLPYSTRSASL